MRPSPPRSPGGLSGARCASSRSAPAPAAPPRTCCRALPAEGYEYTFTDVSPHFLGRAAEKFAAYPTMDYRTLDIEGDLTVQGFAGEQFDLVVAANVLHATADLRHTFANVASLLAPSGLLAMVEMVRPQRFISITFGLTDGWWKFTDRDLRPASLLLGREGWQAFLAGQGFVDPQVVPPATVTAPSALAVQSVVLAGAPSAGRGELPVGRRHWLILADDGGVGDGVAELIRARGGRATVVPAGSPADGDDVLAVLEAASATGLDGVVHLRSLEATAEAALESARCTSPRRSAATGRRPASGWSRAAPSPPAPSSPMPSRRRSGASAGPSPSSIPNGARS